MFVPCDGVADWNDPRRTSRCCAHGSGSTTIRRRSSFDDLTPGPNRFPSISTAVSAWNIVDLRGDLTDAIPGVPME